MLVFVAATALVALGTFAAGGTPALDKRSAVGRHAILSQYCEDVGGSGGKVFALLLHAATGSAALPAVVGVAASLAQYRLALRGDSEGPTVFFGKFCPMIGDTSVRRAYPAQYHALTQWNPLTKLVLAALSRTDTAANYLSAATLPSAIAVHAAAQAGRALVLIVPCAPFWTTAWVLAESFAGDVTTLLINRLQQEKVAERASATVAKRE
jgi:hypothetical protein